MSDVAAPGESSVLPAARERGWWQVLLAAALLLLVPMVPMLRILVPVDQTIVLLAPALAVCALVGWWAGGRLPLAIAWTGLAGWVLWQFAAGGGTIAVLACGWAVLLAAAFGSTTLLQGEDERAGQPFFARALAAIGIALALVTIATFAVPDGGHALPEAIRVEAGRRAEVALSAWRQTTATKEWTDFAAQHAEATTMAKQVESQLQATPGYGLLLFPAMLALESLAALALAWAVYHRVGRARLGPPLAALREFRFNDQLVWGLVLGMALVLVPWFAALSALGANLLVFFGTIYALRGLGVGLWFLAPGRWVMALLIGFSVFFWYVLGVMALGLGLGDTWLDWRTRARLRAERK
ncbi:MAG TPA: hypothetical protein VHE78_12230 [Gemmatimonadaceae bacterium]|nr:hypothetical protein [Gemmatimonadaceae bacterium]